MDYNMFCRDSKGNWDRSKEYEWIFTHVNAEYDNGSYGEYSKQVAKGDDISLVTALLFEAGLRSEGLITPLLTKHIFTSPQDTTDMFELIRSHVSEDRYQELLNKYCKIKSEFTKRHQENQDAIAKRADDSKPKLKVRHFHIGG
jgi:uncharacterized protein YwgA